MDQSLSLRLKKIHEQIEKLYKAEADYLTLDAAKEHKLSKLASEAPSDVTSDAAKKTWAYGTDGWFLFKHGLANAEALFHREKHMLELQNSAFQAQYLSAKIEVELIKGKKE